MSDMINQIPSTTPDFTTEAANKLAQLFPEIVADGKVDIEKLKTILGVDVDDARERFGLTWPGKANAIRAAQTPTTATLMPDKENSIDWDTTQNVFIEGDNLEVLKILQKHYYGQIKMIYIEKACPHSIQSNASSEMCFEGENILLSRDLAAWRVCC
ncbi:hypothetical protein [Actinotignum urinale]|uniref:hypothetical protein n=1 Tax=Actinotignum urinale TaxID=190146 RepID=UPI0003B7A79C|nr:hypothetical protein [Actinotignum urinale]MDY5159681.1 site-specific DNA-methyltransferase (adenine-specific) [Actinotignum urinale]